MNASLLSPISIRNVYTFRRAVCALTAKLIVVANITAVTLSTIILKLTVLANSRTSAGHALSFDNSMFTEVIRSANLTGIFYYRVLA